MAGVDRFVPDWRGMVSWGLSRYGRQFQNKEEIMVYQWNPASRIKADANKAGELFERLEKTVGLTAKTLLDANREEDAPLHGEFEWDDTKAAEAYRETQSAYLIRSLCVVPDGDNKEPVRAVFIVNKATGYESVNLIMDNSEKRSALLDLALKELSAFKRKYSLLQELSEVFTAIDNVTDKC